MFARSDLDKIDLAGDTLHEYPGIHTTLYKHYAFKTSDSEQSICITGAPKHQNDNGLSFWLAAELQEDWKDRERYFRPYVEGAAFREIPESEFNSLVETYCNNLIAKPSLPLGKTLGSFKGALALWTPDEEQLLDLFAEYESGFLHFVWMSTA